MKETIKLTRNEKIVFSVFVALEVANKQKRVTDNGVVLPFKIKEHSPKYNLSDKLHNQVS